MATPLVSVIIPTYNYAQYITEAINGILQQTYPQDCIEIIIIDDGSTDNTQEVIQPFIDKGTVAYHYQQNKGKAFATDAGAKLSKGKYIFNLDADDYYLPEKIAVTVDVFESDDTIVHVASAAKCLFQDTQVTGDENLPAEIIGKPLDGKWLLSFFYENKILYGGGSTYAARASAFKSFVTPAAVDMYIDEFLLLAILPLGKSYFHEKPLSIWRIHTSNYSGKASSKESKIKKNDRLLRSSQATLDYLKSNSFDERIVKIYQLQHLTRDIAFKESLNEKKLSDILGYARKVFFVIKPGWTLIKKHNVVNRLIPTTLLGLLKKAGSK